MTCVLRFSINMSLPLFCLNVKRTLSLAFLSSRNRRKILTEMVSMLSNEIGLGVEGLYRGRQNFICCLMPDLQLHGSPNWPKYEKTRLKVNSVLDHEPIHFAIFSFQFNYSQCYQTLSTVQSIQNLARYQNIFTT